MPYRSRISILKESHRLIDEQIIVMEANNADPLKISEMKKQRLIYKDEIRRMERIQWEHDHDTVDLSDDDY
jgi:hypothetical protein